MKISELLEILGELQGIHGDVPVHVSLPGGAPPVDQVRHSPIFDKVYICPEADHDEN